MSSDEYQQKRNELDDAYTEYNELWRQVRELEARINRLLEETGDEV